MCVHVWCAHVVCLYVFCMSVGTHVRVGTLMYGSPRSTLGVFLDCSSLYLLRWVLSMEPRTGESASQAKGLISGTLCCWSAGWQAILTGPFRRCGDLNLRLVLQVLYALNGLPAQGKAMGEGRNPGGGATLCGGQIE